ncbi:hypothetical protein [Streptomyces sp. bgisy154]|uniref:hypothetical protein n=1 Tax=Streptomyces sp. bgisy154 TaxID=3413794 RepID=UPI003D74A794
MSRETDSPSSGPNGRGGAAYPSGTPPYGTPVVSDGDADAGRSAARPEERKTETTLTTRIRINIPGSRPIPPVVVRKPVGDAEGSGDDTGTHTRPAGAAGTAAGAATAGTAGTTGTPAAAPAPAESAPAAEERTSDWFAPRKSAANKGGQAGGSANGAGVPGASGGSASSAPSAPSTSTGPGAAGAPRPASGAGRPGGVVGSMSVPGGPGSGGPGGKGGSGLPGGATGGPVAPGHGGGTGSFDVTEALNASSRPGTGGDPARDDLPYFSEPGTRQNPGGPSGYGPDGRTPAGSTTPAGPAAPTGPEGYEDFGGFDGPRNYDGSRNYDDTRGFDDARNFAGPQDPLGAGPGATGGPAGPGAAGGRDPLHDTLGGHAPLGGPAGPTGPTTGPVTGKGPMVPPVPPEARTGHPGGPTAPAGPGSQGHAPGGPGNAPGGPGHAPGGPGNTPGAPGAVSGGPRPGGGLSDDTAILTPQQPAPEPGPNGGFPRPDNVSGHTVTSGIPVVPPNAAQGGPFGAPGARSDAPGPQAAPKPSQPGAQSAAPAQGKKKKKGRSKLVLLGGVLVVAGVGVYGAGLLMNHSDVPKGTTVLGVDIGGGTRDDAVKKLDQAFEERAGQPLKLTVDGRTVTLRPDQAGLQFDMQATVDAAAKSDYNPLSVVGSLFGQKRVVEPAMPVDEEKLHAALEAAAGGAGSAVDGTIRFESGKAVAVYGKAGKGIDAARAADAVEDAYRSQVANGPGAAVPVPTAAKQPTVSNAEVDRMMKEFAEPAMSAKVVVKTDDGVQRIAFSPEKSLWKFLQVKAVDGKLVESYDQAALKELYGGAFDGVLITRGTGQKTPVTVQDVISALRPALKSTTDRVAVVDTTPN